MTTDTYAPSAVEERIRDLCRQFRLPTLAAETVGRFSDAGHADALPTLMEVLEQEAEDRRIRRVDRLRRASKLPAGKTWDTFEHERAPVKLRQQLVRLAEGDFVDRGVNVLAFGMPGTGKTHAMCAIGHRLVQAGRSVLFIPAYRLVQDMLAAKRDLDLPRMLRCKRRSDNVPRRRLDSLNPAVENRTACHLPIESIETLMEGDKDVHRGHVFARAQGVPGGGDEHQGGVPGVRAAPRHRAQDALAPRATGIPQEAPSPSPQA